MLISLSTQAPVLVVSVAAKITSTQVSSHKAKGAAAAKATGIHMEPRDPVRSSGLRQMHVPQHQRNGIKHDRIPAMPAMETWARVYSFHL